MYRSYDETWNNRILYLFHFQVCLELVFEHRKIQSVPMDNLISENLFLCILQCTLHFPLYLDNIQWPIIISGNNDVGNGIMLSVAWPLMILIMCSIIELLCL